MAIENRDNLGLIDGQIVFGMRLQSISKAGLGNGVIASSVSSTALKITPDETTPDMTITAQLGSCQIDGGVFTEAADVTSVAIAAAHATNERIDLVFYDQSASTVAVVTGTPHATDPAVPDVATDLDIPLAIVYVLPQDDVSYSGTITSDYIYDIRSFVYIGESGKYTMIGIVELPLKTSTDVAAGSCCATVSTSYVLAGKTKILLPTVIPANRTMVARFKVKLMVAGQTGYAQLYNITTSAEVVELTTTNTNEPQMRESAELSCGAGNNIIDSNIYVINIKTENGSWVCQIYRAWIEFYAKNL